ncbi:MAG: tetratricopeptide repeat protein [Saprospiraceae bacterium]
MKHLLAFCFCLNTVLSYGQVVDSILLRQVDSLIGVSRKLTGQQKFDEATQVGELAQKIALEKFEKESAAYARCLFNRGRIFSLSGRFDDAEPFYLEAKSIREKVLHKEHPDYAWSLNNLGILYWNMGRYEEAEPLLLDAKTIWGKVLPLGEGDPGYAGSLNNLGLLYWKMGRYEEAELLFLEAKSIRGNVLGKENSDYAGSLNNLGLLYKVMGRYEEAEPLLLEAKTIWGKVLGKENSDYATSLNNLAGLYQKMGRYEDAEPLSREANTIWEKNFGKDDEFYSAGLTTLAEIYNDMRRYEAAELLHLEAKAIREKVLGKMHPSYASSLIHLAGLYHRIGRNKDAEPLYLEAKSILEKVLGKTHPDYAATLNLLANLYEDMDRWKDAESLFREANAIINALLSNSSRYLSDRELAAYVQLFTKDLDHYYSFAQMNRGKFIGFSASCYDNALFHKGFLLNVSSHISNLAASNSIAERLNNRLKSYHRRLAKEYTKPIAERKEVGELEELANSTEKELIRSVTGFDEAIRQVNWQNVRATLEPGEAAIEFIHYRYYNPFRTDSILYAALILKPGDVEPRLVPLFEERQLERLLPRSNDMDRIDGFYKTSTGKLVFDLVWQPLDDLLVGINTVYCSPSGLLHRINLGAIPVPPTSMRGGRTFANRHRLVLLGSTRQLVNQIADVLPASMQAVLFGGINYDAGTEVAENTTVRDTLRLEQPVFERSITAAPFFFDTTSQTWVTSRWKPLPGTETEVRHIAGQLLKHRFSTQLLTQSAATEESFKQIGRTETLPTGQRGSPRIIHLATHGYFFPDPATNPNEDIGDKTSFVFKSSKQPMIRSGLILAGANASWVTRHSPAEREDGILTAYEISQQNLSNTELVVLSACETGLGHIEGNEGVYGLQRAFKIAGAKYLIMSLWQVNDQKTRELMIEFYYQYLDQNLPVPEAFRLAQHAMRTKYPGSPYVWAAFVLIE